MTTPGLLFHIGFRYLLYLSEGLGPPLGDVWTDIPALGAGSIKALGYPTQKPEALLNRIISSAGRNVVDNFETAIRRDGKHKGYIVAFSFGSGASKKLHGLAVKARDRTG